MFKQSLIQLVVSIGALFSLMFSVFAIQLYRVYKKYNLRIIQIKAMLCLSLAIYSLLTFLGNVAPSLILASIFFSFSVLAIFISGIVVFVYFRFLRLEKISDIISIIVVLLFSIKAISLSLDPIRVYNAGGINLREAHLCMPSLLATIIVSTMIIMELFLLVRDCLKIPPRRKYAVKIGLSYVPAMLNIPLLMLGTESIYVSILIPYIQGFLVGLSILILFIMFRKNLEKLAILPVEVFGLTLHNYAGIRIMEEKFVNHADRIIALSNLYVMYAITMMTELEEGGIVGTLRTHHLFENTILVYYGEMVIGTLITSRDNSVLRNILKNIVDEFEKRTGFIPQNVIMDEELGIARDVVRKYLPFLL